jgi:hypothetical protein
MRVPKSTFLGRLVPQEQRLAGRTRPRRSASLYGVGVCAAPGGHAPLTFRRGYAQDLGQVRPQPVLRQSARFARRPAQRASLGTSLRTRSCAGPCAVPIRTPTQISAHAPPGIRAPVAPRMWNVPLLQKKYRFLRQY